MFILHRYYCLEDCQCQKNHCVDSTFLFCKACIIDNNSDGHFDGQLAHNHFCIVLIYLWQKWYSNKAICGFFIRAKCPVMNTICQWYKTFVSKLLDSGAIILMAKVSRDKLVSSFISHKLLPADYIGRWTTLVQRKCNGLIERPQ